jgi:hypothetical protein
VLRAARGQREVGGRVEDIENEDLLQRVRAVARQVNLRAVLLTAILTAAVGLCSA